MVGTIRLDEALWSAASPARRADWRTSIAEATEEGGLGPWNLTLAVLPASEGVQIRRHAETGDEVHWVRSDALDALVREYLDVIRRMEDAELSASSARMQALDMAKRVVHDKGATVLAAAIPLLGVSHEGYRRLFTLVLSMLVDVTSLGGHRAHRRHFR